MFRQLMLIRKGFQAILKTQTSETHFRHLHSELQASCVTYGSFTSIVLSLKKKKQQQIMKIDANLEMVVSNPLPI